MARPRRLDAADAFVYAATRAFAVDAPPPAPPADDVWVTRARDAGVLAPVAAALARAGHPVPEMLRRLRQLTAARQLSTAADLSTVGAALDAADVPWAVLKGPVLSSIVFASPDVREYTDLDVLVAPSRVGAAVDALVAAGAELLDVDWAHVNHARTAELGLRLPGGTVLDLHWSLVNLGRTRDAYDPPVEALLADRVVRRPATPGARPFPTLDDLSLVVHVLLHGCLSGGHQLRWLLDAQQCVRWLDATPADLGRRARELRASTPARAVHDSVTTHLDPRVRPWSAAMRPAVPWNVVLGVVSRKSPPSAPSASRRAGRAWFAATRPTSAASVRALAGTAASSWRYRRSGWPAGEPRPASTTDAGYREWLAIAGGSGTTVNA